MIVSAWLQPRRTIVATTGNEIKIVENIFISLAMCSNIENGCVDLQAAERVGMESEKRIQRHRSSMEAMKGIRCEESGGGYCEDGTQQTGR